MARHAAATAPADFRAWYEALLSAWGPQGWWPGRSRFEVMVGAVLTQAVAWTNVERAIATMRRERLLTPAALRAAGPPAIERAIRPAGYHVRKARTLRALVTRIDEGHAGSLARFLAVPVPVLRRELLTVPGIGPETADAILLYAAGRPVFVIDAYTRRILARHGAARGDEPYDTLRLRFETALPDDARLFNEFHALLVRAGKEHCGKAAARCDGCPLRPFLPDGGPNPARRIRRGRRPARRRGRVD
ncbi:MAG TPA: endonuclease III domain-containing protein [Candidatus Polarisedimenticolia bacterium]|nr:endonuclease III domain-containing protein [Candidatus Polarisedimenticolia bacterium]